MSDPWIEYSHIWPTKARFFTYIRGCLRSAWNKNPVKHEYVKQVRKKIDNPNPKGNKPTVWGFECEMCEKEFPIKLAQVDHIIPAGSLNEKEDIQGFVERLLFVSSDDIRLVCKECNSSLSYAEKHQITYEQAVREKEVIAFSKLTAQTQRAKLIEMGASDEQMRTAKNRKNAYRELLK